MLVMMATNLPEALDEALLRPGRIDRIYKVGYPSKAGRVRTYEGYFAKVRHELTPDQMDKLATITPYATGATIKDLVNEALITAIRDGRDVITWGDVIRAKQLKELGPPEDVEYIERERHAVAIHEALETHKTLTGEDVVAVIERHPGPFVDGRPYAEPSLIERLEDYHRKAAVAHVEHSQGALSMPEIPQPVLAAPGPGGWLVAPDPDPLNRQGHGNGSETAGGPAEAGGPGLAGGAGPSGPPDGSGPTNGSGSGPPAGQGPGGS
jgi:hypothetical protein